MVKYRYAGIIPWAVISLTVFAGCGAVATRTGFHQPIIENLENRDFQGAVSRIEKARSDGKYGKKDRFLYYLDSGAIYHYAGLPDSSNDRLAQAEYAAEELYTKSVTRAAGSMILNDNLLEYTGEDYEILYTNLLMSLNYLSLGSFDDAFVEVRRANEKLQLLEQKYADAASWLNEGKADNEDAVDIDYEAAKIRFNNDAFARYLSMRIYAADGRMDDARIDYDYLVDAYRTQPHIYYQGLPDVHIAADSGALLSVVAFAGLAPVKEALNLRIRTDKDLDLVQILYTDSENEDAEYGHLPLPVSEDYYFKFAIPKLVLRYSRVSEIQVFAGSELLGSLDLLEDVSKVAGETFKAKSSLIYLRTVARAVAKGLAAHKAKEKADSGGLEGWLKKAAIDVATDISENADLRCGRYLPGRVFARDFEVDPGIYDIEIVFLDSFGAKIESRIFRGQSMEIGGLNLLHASCLR